MTELIDRRALMALLAAAVLSGACNPAFAKDGDSEGGNSGSGGGGGSGHGGNDDSDDDSDDDDSGDDGGNSGPGSGSGSGGGGSKRDDALALKRILRQVRKAYRGDIVDVRLRRSLLGSSYNIKLIAPGGKLRRIRVDAKSGKVLSEGSI